MTVGALGVVFGDIGTSPLYTIQTAFNPGNPQPVAVTESNVFGIVSLIFWAVTLIVTVKYVLLVMRADNDGEGGTLALITLIQRGSTTSRRRTSWLLSALGIFGASLFFGDSIITPAISVLSAVEGLKVVDPSLQAGVIPATVVIIVMLFTAQRLGTAKVGRLFGPVMIVWFVAIGALGAVGVASRPSILAALSPTYAVGFVANQFSTAFFALAAVVLAVTGAEALYADLGHFGRAPITRAWLLLVFPACILNYLGQSALILNDQSAVANPFFLLVPGWGRLPMVILASVATVIASQAVISGAFSLAQQAVQLGYLPRLRTIHTSAKTIGQVYLPWVNWVLMVSVLTLVFAFQTSAALAYAYGMAVTGTFAITTVLFFYIARQQWRQPVWLVVLGVAVFLSVELLLLAANLTKLVRGAWLPLLIGVTVFTVMTTWKRGRSIVLRERKRQEGELSAFVEKLHRRRPPLLRVPGTAVFLNRDKDTTPLALRANVEHNHVLHEHVVVMSIHTLPVPFVEPGQWVSVDSLGHTDDGIMHVEVTIGYLDHPNVPELLRIASDAESESSLEAADATYYLSTIELVAGNTRDLAKWRQKLFIATSHITADAAEYFELPRDRTIIMGSRISI